MKLATLMILAAAASLGQATILYDGASGVLPDDPAWGWNYAATGGTATAAGGVASLDTTANIAFSAGWGRVSPVVLDATIGFTVNFDVRIDAEDHSSPGADKNGDGLADRAGFSVIVLGSDKKGVELAFWNNEIWAQQDSPLFVHSPASERAFVGTGSMTSYELSMVGSTYILKAGNVQILTGTRKDYGAFSGFPDPYETPNFLFFGDNTTSASGHSSIRLIEASAVPEPASLGLVAVGFLALAFRRSRKKSVP